MNMQKKKLDDRLTKTPVVEIRIPSSARRFAAENASKLGNGRDASIGTTPSSTRNMNFFIDASDHRLLRSHSIETNRSLQSIMAEALNLYLAQHGLGPIKLVKAYRV